MITATGYDITDLRESTPSMHRYGTNQLLKTDPLRIGHRTRRGGSGHPRFSTNNRYQLDGAAVLGSRCVSQRTSFRPEDVGTDTQLSSPACRTYCNAHFLGTCIALGGRLDDLERDLVGILEVS
jgi:hypothetical protein